MNGYARYHDTAQSQEIEMVAGNGEPSYTIRKQFKDEAEASKAALAKLDAFQRGKSTVNLELPGNPSFLAEAPLTLYGFRDGVNGSWVVETATHTLSNEGYTVTLDGSVKK